MPDIPSIPDTPDKPENPGTKEKPELPEQPDKPSDKPKPNESDDDNPNYPEDLEPEIQFIPKDNGPNHPVIDKDNNFGYSVIADSFNNQKYAEVNKEANFQNKVEKILQIILISKKLDIFKVSMVILDLRMVLLVQKLHKYLPMS